MPTRPSPIDVADVLARYEAGEVAASIVADYAVTPSAIRKVLSRHGVKRHLWRTDHQRAEVLRVHARGKRQGEIAAQTGLTRWAVRRVLDTR
jgi:predicted transcriptional regulator